MGLDLKINGFSVHIDPNTSHSRQYNDEQVHKATVPPDLTIREASLQN